MDESLAASLKKLQSEHDVLPFMQSLHPSNEMRWRELPDDMLSLLQSSPDFRELDRESGPVWLQLAAPDDHADELIVCRRGDQTCFVIAPEKSGD